MLACLVSTVVALSPCGPLLAAAAPLAPAPTAPAPALAQRSPAGGSPNAPPKLLPPAPPADAEAAGRVLAERVQKFYEKTRDFSASFEQAYKYKAMQRVQRSSGTVQVKKPGMMRWDYVQPYEKHFVLDGRSLWMHEPADNAVSVQRQFSSDALSSAVTFLWGRGRLTDEFHVTTVARPELGAAVLELVPRKPQTGFSRLFFVIDEATGAVQTSLVVDSQGNENRITFKDAATNTGLPDARFQFEVPKGVAVRELKQP
jgi:outer membrane lipoprotein carrier protein